MDPRTDAVRRHIEGSNRHDPVALAAPFAETALNHGRATSKKGAERVAESLFAAFPDLNFEITATVVQDETVMCEMTMTGTHLGTPALPVLGGHLTGAAPTGRVEYTSASWRSPSPPPALKAV